MKRSKVVCFSTCKSLFDKVWSARAIVLEFSLFLCLFGAVPENEENPWHCYDKTKEDLAEISLRAFELIINRWLAGSTNNPVT